MNDGKAVAVKPYLSKRRNAIDLTGHVYGRLTVIGFTGRDKKGNSLWLCQCECGTKKVIASHQLRKNKEPVRSCGCIRKYPKGVGSMRKLLYGYKRDAKRRDLCFQLTQDQFATITTQRCHYCGAYPLQCAGEPNHNGFYLYNGIDRINNDEGYTTDNVVPCCKVCNRMKTDMSRNLFLQKVTIITRYLAEVQNERRNSQI